MFILLKYKEPRYNERNTYGHTRITHMQYTQYTKTHKETVIHTQTTQQWVTGDCRLYQLTFSPCNRKYCVLFEIGILLLHISNMRGTYVFFKQDRIYSHDDWTRNLLYSQINLYQIILPCSWYRIWNEYFIKTNFIYIRLSLYIFQLISHL